MIGPDELNSIVIFDVTEHNLPEDGHFVPLLRLWNGRRGDAAIPSRSVMPAEDLAAWLGHLAVLERVGSDFRFRLFGSLLTVAWREDLTGRRLSDLPDPLALLLEPVCLRCAGYGRPALVQYHAPQRFGSRPRRNLLLPMRAEGGAVHLLMASYDVPAPERPGTLPRPHLLSCPLEGEN